MDENDLTRTIGGKQEDAPLPSHGAAPRLVVVEGLTPGTTVPLDRPATTIGRLPDNDLVLASPAVSKHHARVLHEGEIYYVEDVGSTNGVVVNGARVAPKERRQLCHGDSIQISDHLVLFYHHGTFSDRKGLSTIVFDAGKVKDEAARVLEELPGVGRRGGRTGEAQPPGAPGGPGA